VNQARRTHRPLLRRLSPPGDTAPRQPLLTNGSPQQRAPRQEAA
jgi:hypothetical protein